MGDQMISSAVTVMMAIVGLAIIATLVSKNANTTNVITATGRSFSGALTAAEAPVLGGLNVAGTSSYSGFQY
jgi:PRD1 phage membrane DNA delivery